MMGLDLVKTAFYTKLNAAALASSILPDDVAEANYQSRSFTYPCLRYLVTMTPEQDDEACAKFRLEFEVVVYSESPSSLEASQIASEVITRLRTTVLTVSGHTSTPLRPNQPTTYAPLERGWRQHVYFGCFISGD